MVTTKPLKISQGSVLLYGQEQGQDKGQDKGQGKGKGLGSGGERHDMKFDALYFSPRNHKMRRPN